MTDPFQPRHRRRPMFAMSREAGAAMTIPNLMLSGLLSGLILGWLAKKIFQPTPPWDRRIMLAGLLFGVVGGFYEAFKVMRQISRATDEAQKRERKRRKPSS